VRPLKVLQVIVITKPIALTDAEMNAVLEKSSIR
jgi:hypothetical protein